MKVTSCDKQITQKQKLLTRMTGCLSDTEDWIKIKTNKQTTKN